MNTYPENEGFEDLSMTLLKVENVTEETPEWQLTYRLAWYEREDDMPVSCTTTITVRAYAAYDWKFEDLEHLTIGNFSDEDAIGDILSDEFAGDIIQDIAEITGEPLDE